MYLAFRSRFLCDGYITIKSEVNIPVNGVIQPHMSCCLWPESSGQLWKAVGFRLSERLHLWLNPADSVNAYGHDILSVEFSAVCVSSLKHCNYTVGKFVYLIKMLLLLHNMPSSKMAHWEHLSTLNKRNASVSLVSLGSL